jgi:hypothetical protein
MAATTTSDICRQGSPPRNSWRTRKHLTTGWSDRGSRLRWGREGVDDWDKVPSFDAGEAPRRTTSSLDDTPVSASARYLCRRGASLPFLWGLGSSRREGRAAPSYLVVDGNPRKAALRVLVLRHLVLSGGS